jgi:hypothetical protein
MKRGMKNKQPVKVEKREDGGEVREGRGRRGGGRG